MLLLAVRKFKKYRAFTQSQKPWLPKEGDSFAIYEAVPLRSPT
jgi:hypothetical protein